MRKTVTFKDYMRRLFIRYTVALIAFMFLVFIVFMALNYRLFIMKANEDCNQQVSSFVAEQYAVYQQGAAALAANPQIRGALSGEGGIMEVNRLLYQFCLAQPIKANFALLQADGGIVSTNLYKPNQMLFQANRTVQEMLARLAADPSAAYSGVARIPYDFGQKSDLMFARAVRSDEGRLLGYLAFGLQEEGFSEFMRNHNADIIVITDRFNNVIFSTNSLLIDSMGKYKADQENSSTTVIDQKPYYLTADFSAVTGVWTITMTSVAKQQQFSRFGGIFLFGISCFLILLVRVAAKKVTARNLHSIDELLLAVNECRQGNIHYQIKSQTFEEFQTLYDEFNQAMVKLQQLLAHNNELAERKRRMEVKHLEGQFNPHFVFNVMEALRYEILIDPAQASTMIVAFANLMRYSINYGSTHVLLQTDIGYVQDYLLLQKMRYNQRLTYSIDIAEDLLACKVPKLLIQPIVENSIVHGMENTRQLTVRITGQAQDNDLILCVEDDGPGMSETKLAALRLLLDTEDAMPQRIGLYNVHRAAQLLYGKAYGLTLASKGGKGMRVMLRIPAIAEDSDV